MLYWRKKDQVKEVSMGNMPSREQYIKQAKRIRSIEMFMVKLKRLFPLKKRYTPKTVFIETEFGKVRTLWYGSDTAGNSPVYFNLHGGGFILGGPEMDETTNIILSKQIGCTIVAIDYAKAPAFPYPTAINQVYAVVKHIHENAMKYHIDGNKMAIGGYSAGANISTVCCIKANKEGAFRFVCQVLDYPPLDLSTSAWEKPQPRGSISPRMASMFNACYVDAEHAKDPFVSPIYSIPEDLKGLPPALIILAGKDSLFDEGLKYMSLLNEARVTTECYEYMNAVHGFTYKASEDTKDALDKTLRFLGKYMSKK
jgi:acetyl esterase